MKFGVLVFPGSNCDHDTSNVIEQIAHQPVTMLWHESEDLQGCDAILVPGGFATATTCAPALSPTSHP
jgi:phosphoribosylformylglycinamidine (FGAM) synthase-like amidotransferase family enzyme